MFEAGEKIKIKKEFIDMAKALQDELQKGLGISKPMTFKCYDGGSLLVEENEERWAPTYFEEVSPKKKPKGGSHGKSGKTKKS